MLAQIIHDLLEYRYTPVYGWLCNHLGVDHLGHVTVQESTLCITEYLGTPKHHHLTDKDIFSNLLNHPDKILATKIVWFCLRHYDTYDETNDMLHDYLANLKIIVERVPFLCKGDWLLLSCANFHVKKAEKELIYKIVGTPGRGTLCISLATLTLQNLLFGRLRRYLNAQN